MRLFEAIIEANHRAVEGDQNAGLHPGDFPDELPVIALTCVDPRLNSLFPSALGLPAEKFIWLRNAGNIITSTTSSTMRSLALACAVKGGKEIAIIGHTDCQVASTTTMQLIERLRAIGVERHLLPDNLSEFFGVFGSERQNVIKGAGLIRQSPLIGPRIPVHGLMVDIRTGKLDWLVNGYQAMEFAGPRPSSFTQTSAGGMDAPKPLSEFKIGEMKFPEGKIGETIVKMEDWLSKNVQQPKPEQPSQTQEEPQVPPELRPVHPQQVYPQGLPLPPIIRPKVRLHKGGRR